MKTGTQTLALITCGLLAASCHTTNHFTRPPSRNPFTNEYPRAEYERGYEDLIRKGFFVVGDGANGLRSAYALGADDAYHDKATFLKLSNYRNIYDDATYMRQRQASIGCCEKEMKRTSQPPPAPRTRSPERRNEP